MSNAEQILIDYHRSRGDHKIRLRSEIVTSEGSLYIMRFYNPNGSCYSSLDKIDENGVVTEIQRCHQLDERKVIDSMMRGRSHETDRQ
jgi:hypothetical protein